jgi:hypothetical protein
MIAIDEYNTWFQKTVFGYEGKDVAPQDIGLIRAFTDIDASGYREDRKLANGVFIAASTENFPSSYTFSKQVHSSMLCICCQFIYGVCDGK